MDKFTFLSVGDTPAIPEGTEIYVYTDSGGTIQATIYLDDGTTPITQPVLADANGEFSFRAANGTYWIKIDAEPLVEFRMFDGTGLAWNATDHTFDITTGLGGVVLQVGQEDLLIAYNNTGVAIPDFTPVSLDGSSGTRPLVYVTDFTNATAVRCFVGVTTMAIPHGEHGFICRKGLVRNVNTNAYADADRIWGTGTGGMTVTEPTTGYKVLLGMVIKGGSVGGGIFYSNPRIFQTASETPFTATGSIAATNTQDAIAELGTEKVAIAQGYINGQNDTRTDLTPADGATATLDCSLGNAFKITAPDTGAGMDFTIALSNVPAGAKFFAISVDIIVGTNVPTITVTGKGTNVTAPTLTASRNNVWILSTWDNGTTIQINDGGKF